MAKLRVFLVDDHPIVRDGLKAIIGEHPEVEVAGEAADGLTAYDGIVATQPDVVVMDVSLPGANGLQLTERLSREHPSIKVLTLTVHEENGYITELLKAGAKGYVLKRTVSSGLIQALQVVVAGGVYLDPNIASKLVSKIGRPSRTEGMLFTEIELSDREVEVVKQTAAGFGNKEIAARLDLSVKTIETYRARAMEKLGLQGRPDLVRYAQLRGWLKEV
jgi:DNA-binding NarL/FixJ family response regulator